MNTKITLLCLGIAASSSMAFSSSVSAAGVKILPGSICQPSSGANVSKILYSAAGVSNSSSTAGVGVTCPLERDNYLNTTGTDFVQVYVFRSASATIALQCILSSRDKNGAFVESQVASFNGVGAGVISLDVSKSTIGGYYSLSCSLPQFSAVRSIYLDEPI